MPSERVLERQAERRGASDHGRFDANGGSPASGQNHGEFSPGTWRTSAGQKHRPFESTSTARFGARPSAGKVADVERGPQTPGKDDGSAYFSEYRSHGSFVPMPKAKTPKQDRLARLCARWIAGERGEQIETVISATIDLICSTDPRHGYRWAEALRCQGFPI